MPTADFFQQHGLFAVRNFFDRKFCDRICMEIRSAANDPSKIRRGSVAVPKQISPHINTELRRTEFRLISEETAALARQKLLEVMPQAAEHFKVELKDCQEVKFGVYREGDFFKRHIDVLNTADALPEVKERRVSVVVFLNEEVEEPSEGAYGGGNLTFYGLMKNSVFGNFGYPLNSEPGLFIAFPPNVIHEVTPVTHGERYVVITWYK